MKRFNLSAWAVSHPALVLFLIIALGVAGFFSYETARPRRGSLLHCQGGERLGDLARRHGQRRCRTQVADPIEKKLQELPYFEKVQTYSKPGFTAMQVTFRNSTPPKDVPYLFYLLRKKLVDVQGQLPSGLLGPVVNDEFSDVDSILYMMTSDGADYAQLKKAAEGLRQRLLEGLGRDQGRYLRHPGREDLRRVLACEARHARHHAAGAVQFARQAEQCRAGRHGGDLLATRAAARHRRARRRQGGGGDAGRKQWPRVPAGRYRHRQPRLRRSAELRRASGRQARDRHRRGDRQGRQHSRTRQGCRRRDRRNS